MKGCWFHFCQALTRKLQNLGLKTRYINDYDFRFWCKQFSALAIISTEHLKQAMDTILTNGINYKQEQAVLKFIKYLNNQWLHGSQPPDIWNHFENYEKRTNNDLEGYHSDLDKHFPKYNPSLESVVKFFKKFNALSVDRLIKIRLHQYKRVKSKLEQQKDMQFALINEEFKRKSITFEEYFEKITFACLSQHEFNSQNDFDEEIATSEELENFHTFSKDFKRNWVQIENKFKETNFLEFLEKAPSKTSNNTEKSANNNEARIKNTGVEQYYQPRPKEQLLKMKSRIELAEKAKADKNNAKIEKSNDKKRKTSDSVNIKKEKVESTAKQAQQVEQAQQAQQVEQAQQAQQVEQAQQAQQVEQPKQVEQAESGIIEIASNEFTEQPSKRQRTNVIQDNELFLKENEWLSNLHINAALEIIRSTMPVDELGRAYVAGLVNPQFQLSAAEIMPIYDFSLL